MPVNDSPDAAQAEVNCGLCSVAGIVGSTAETERGLVEAQIGVGRVKPEWVFFVYATRVMGLPKGDTAKVTLGNQARGMEGWLRNRHARRLGWIGSTEAPLQLAEMEQAMMLLPDGTQFLVAVLDWNEAWGQSMNAHWLTARRAGAAISYVDHQLDIPGTMVDDLARKTKRRNAPFGQASVTNGPRQAWADPTEGTNRYAALSVQ